MAGIFFEPQDTKRAYKTLSNYSEKVLMSNYTGQSGGLMVLYKVDFGIKKEI